MKMLVMWQLVSAVGRLLHWWWQADRIRVSPREGWHLRLQPGDLLRIAGRSAVVKSRQVQCDAEGWCIVSHCEDDGAEAFDLIVRQSRGAASFWLQYGNESCEIAAGEVNAIPGASRPKCCRRCSS
jgi:hypothetical protein